ncbi:MAG TPA: phosphotransferase [Iamia sp.]|nr:phosphotransferase [Iamia sp.]
MIATRPAADVPDPDPEPTAVPPRRRRGPRSHLTSGGLALILTSGITSVLGLPYWVIAARSYSAAEVGIGSALVSTMLLLSSVATGGLKRSLIRFVAEAGAGARRLVTRTYALALVAGCGAAGVFVAGVGVWAPDLDVLHDDLFLGAAFVVGVGFWGIFQLQDSVLVAVRRPWIVPLENVGFSVAKIVLLVGLAAVVPVAGVFLSWSVPALLAVVAVNGWLIRTGATPPPVEGVVAASSREMGRFAGLEHLASLLWHATMHATPLLVLALLGPDQNASYYVTTQIAYALYLVGSNVGDVLVAEGAIERRNLHASLRTATRQVVGFLVPGVLVLALGAPWILATFGGGYSADATTLLRLLALSSVPNTVVSLLVGVAHVRGRMRRVVGVYAAIAVASLGGAALVLGPWGLTGLGWLWLVTQTVAAVALTVVTCRDEPELARAARDVLVGGARTAMAAHRRRWARHRLPVALGLVPEEVRAWHDWEVQDAHDDRVILRRGDGQQLIRAATGPRGVDAVVAHAIGLRALADDDRLGAAGALLPRLVAAADDGTWMVESARPGTPAALLAGPAQATARAGAIAAVDRIHEATAEVTVVDEHVLDRWVDGPGAVVARALTDGRSRARLDAVLAGLRADLAGRRVTTSRVHGALSLDEVLADEDGTVTGIVDWEATGTGLPELDVVHLLATERRRTEGGELGPHLVALATDGLDPEEARLRAGTVPANVDLPLATLARLAWLQHAAAHLLTSRADVTHRWWLRANVDRVLTALAPTTPRAGDQIRRLPVGSDRQLGGGAGRVTLGLGVAAAVAWVAGLWGADPADMTDLGLLSLLTPLNAVALVLVLAAFGIEVARRQPSTWRLATPVVLLVAALHGTPAVLYGTLRYAWAWKHLGIVDYIDRHGAVDPGIGTLDVYHNWPGFFSQMAGLLDLAGVDEPSRILRWWPLLIELATIPVLLFVFSAFSADKRVRWTGVLLFMATNWVGQDYFSPQSEAFVLYLALVGVFLRGFARRPDRPRWWETSLDPDEDTPAWPLGWTVALVGVLVAAIVTSHQVTPFMVMVALAALAVTRRVRTGWALVATVGLALVWAGTGARTFVEDNLSGLASTVGQPASNAGENFVDVTTLSAHQQLVSTMGRLTVVGIAAVAGLAVLRQVQLRRLRLEPLTLAACPVVMVLTNSFDGEIVFRTYLFALPFLAWLAADGLWSGRRPPRPGRRAVAVAVVTALLLGGFLFGYYGKDQWYRFSEDEVAASALVLRSAEPGSLLVTGTDNYPVQFADYERLTYVPIASEPVDSRDEVLADPADVLASWMGESDYTDAYVLLTRSMRDEADATGLLPAGALVDVEAALRADPRFTAVFDTPDATVFALADR